MKNRIFLLMGSLLMLTMMEAFAQDQQITLQQPLINQTSSWIVNVSDKTGKPLSVLMKVSVQYEKLGTVMEFTTQKISLQSMLSLPWSVLTTKYISTSNIQADFKDPFLGNKDLPLGNYQICLTLLSDASIALTEDCQSFLVDNTALVPPLLINPSHGDTIQQSLPVFTWVPPAPLKDNSAAYSFFLYEISKGQTPEAAVVKNQPDHQMKDIKTPLYNYPSTGLALKVNQAYAWQITAQVGSQILPSNIEHFVFGKISPPVPAPPKPSGIMYFQLSKEESNNYYHLSQPYLYFIYVNENTSKALTYSILNADGTSLLDGKLEATYGYNLLSLDLSKLNLEKNTFSQLVIKKAQAPTQQLLFLFDPQN